MFVVFEDKDLNEKSVMVVEKAVHHGPEPFGESFGSPGVEVGQVERVSAESVRPNKTS